MIIGFLSKYKNLMHDISCYWTIYELDLNKIDSYDVIIIDIDKANDQIIQSNKLIIGITEYIKVNKTIIQFDDIIRIPYDLSYIMFKLNKIETSLQNPHIKSYFTHIKAI